MKDASGSCSRTFCQGKCISAYCLHVPMSVSQPALLLLDEPSNHSTFVIHVILSQGQYHAFSWSQCSGVVGRLSSNMAGNSPRCVCYLAVKHLLCWCLRRSHDRAFLWVAHVHFLMTLKMHRDAVATDIVHQHSGRLDYYKGFVKWLHRNALVNIFVISGTLLNSIPQNRTVTVIYAKNTTLRWTTVNICRRLLTGGGIMQTAVWFGGILLQKKYH